MPAQDSDYRLSKPETLLQTHWLPEASAIEPQTHGRLMTPTMPLCALNMAEEGTGHGATPKDIPGTLQGLWCSSPPSEALRAHTVWTKIDPG